MPPPTATTCCNYHFVAPPSTTSKCICKCWLFCKLTTQILQLPLLRRLVLLQVLIIILLLLVHFLTYHYLYCSPPWPRLQIAQALPHDVWRGLPKCLSRVLGLGEGFLIYPPPNKQGSPHTAPLLKRTAVLVGHVSFRSWDSSSRADTGGKHALRLVHGKNRWLLSAKEVTSESGK